jgi:hypothetical protein
MGPIPRDQLDVLLGRASIRVAAPTLGIGREISYVDTPRRTIVVHFAKSDAVEYVRSVMSRILDADEEWLLLSRYGSVSDLGLLTPASNSAAISFAQAEQPALVEYLCTRPTNAGSISADLYLLSRKGNSLVTWDHHTADEGLVVHLKSIADTNRLLVSLNELGAELEVFYCDD